MIAETQYELDADAMDVVLAIARAGTLAGSAARLGVDASTVFRALQRIEKALGQPLFERTRAGYRPTDLAAELIPRAERIEAELEAARAAASARGSSVSGSVRVTTTDTLLYGLVMPALPALARAHPLLHLELTAANELANLTRRDADIALRATGRPPGHLVGRALGVIRASVFGPASAMHVATDDIDLAMQPWIAPDDALPDHPSVRWRRRHLPKARVRFSVNSILAVREGIVRGLGIGVLPQFLARGDDDLQPLTGALDECETQLWLLTHPESRHLRRVSTVFTYLAGTLVLD